MTTAWQTLEDFARAAHGGQVGPDGRPFIEHPLRVARAVASGTDDPSVIAAALLHDTVEKGGVNWSDLARAGVDPEVVSAVDALTRRGEEPEEAYLDRCRADPIAYRVKRFDLLDKLQPDYLARLPEEEATSVADSTRQKLVALYGEASVPAVQGPHL